MGSTPIGSKPLTRFDDVHDLKWPWIDTKQIVAPLNLFRRSPACGDIRHWPSKSRVSP